jgi:AcrR family transcriptional regulator
MSSHQHQKDTRERILETTRRLLETRRGESVRLEDIAHAAGVSRQAIYLHFSSRADLFVATARYLDTVLKLPDRLEQVCRACETGGGVAGLRESVAFWGRYLPEIYGLAKALLALRDTDEAAAAAWEDRMAVNFQGWVTVVQQLASEGALSPVWTVTTAAEFFWALTSVEVWERLTIERGWSNEQYIDHLQRAIERALLAPS